jgi:small-conductance mechanosensitive channel
MLVQHGFNSRFGWLALVVWALIACGATVALGDDLALPAADVSPASALTTAPVVPTSQPLAAKPPLNHFADKGSPALPPEAKAGSIPVVAEVSQAEQITRIERTIDDDRKRIEQLRADLQSPESEFNLAEAAFKTIDEHLEAAKVDAQSLKDDGDAAGFAEAEAGIADMTKTWRLARERFDLAIETRKTLQQQMAALEEKLTQDQAALGKLKGNVVPQATTAPVAETLTPASDPQTAAAKTDAASSPATSLTAEAVPTAPSPAPTAVAAPSANPALAAISSEAPAAAKPVSTEPAVPVVKRSKELAKAQSDADLKKEEAAEAERDVLSVSGRISALERDIGLEQKLLLAAQRKSDIAVQSGEALDEEYDKRAAEGTSAVELRELRSKRRDTEQLVRKAREEIRDRTARLNQLQQQLAELQREELAALVEAQNKQTEAEQAEEVVSDLSNPYALRNLMQWMLDHGPKVGLILLSMLLLRLCAVLSSQRFVTVILERGARGTKQEREDRARTLLGVFRNAFSITIVIGGLLMLCEEVGIAIAPLMGGAAVLGLAAAFGAQNLIRDYFYGFVILIENQYKINDVLRIGDMTGQVEQITLRMTVLRDIEGSVHFIPNGKIDSVTNMTHGWSRALLEVSVAYKENVDHVMEVLVDLALELRKDPIFGSLIIDNPEMLGVDGLGDSGVLIKMLMKTRPLQQWKVKREMLRRIKQRFDELDIEIPFPQQTVHHFFDGENENNAAIATDSTPRPKWNIKKAA